MSQTRQSFATDTATAPSSRRGSRDAGSPKRVSFAKELSQIYVVERVEADEEEWDGTIGALLRRDVTLESLFGESVEVIDDDRAKEVSRKRTSDFFCTSYAVSKPISKMSQEELRGLTGDASSP